MSSVLSITYAGGIERGKRTQASRCSGESLLHSTSNRPTCFSARPKLETAAEWISAIEVDGTDNNLRSMVNVVYLSPQQAAIVEEVKASDARFGTNETLFHSSSAIAAAKALIEKAVAAGLDQRVFHPLQIWVSLHETEQGMPEHLRAWAPKP